MSKKKLHRNPSFISTMFIVKWSLSVAKKKQKHVTFDYYTEMMQTTVCGTKTTILQLANIMFKLPTYDVSFFNQCNAKSKSATQQFKSTNEPLGNTGAQMQYKNTMLPFCILCRLSNETSRTTSHETLRCSYNMVSKILQLQIPHLSLWPPSQITACGWHPNYIQYI